MNLTQTAGTSWACKYQPANFMRTELFFPRWGGGQAGGGGVDQDFLYFLFESRWM